MKPAPDDWLADLSRADRGVARALFAPLPAQAFLRSSWLRVPTVLHDREGSSGRRSLLPSNAELWELLAKHESLRTTATIVRGGKAPASRGGARSFREIRRQFHGERASVVIHGLDSAAPFIGRLTRALSALFRAPTFSNAYLTPGGAWAFPTHWDCHEAIVLQVAGSKEWSLYRPVIEDPLEVVHDSRSYRFRTGRPTSRVRLEAGDLLYIPRGVPHRAACRSEASTHITFAVTLPTWFDLVRDATLGALATLHDRVSARAFAPVRLHASARETKRADARLRRLCAAVARATEREAVRASRATYRSAP